MPIPLRCAALALTAGFALAGCQRAPSAQGEREPVLPGAPPGIGPSSDQPPGAPAGSGAPTASLSIADPAGGSGPFRLDALDALHVRLRYTGPAGVHAGSIDVVDPHGTLFAQLPATLEVTEARAATADFTLRVRGTPVEQLHQVGTWQLIASVDRTPLASASVDLTDAPAR